MKYILILFLIPSVVFSQAHILHAEKGEKGEDGTDGNTLTATEITSMGFVMADTNTQLTESDVDAFVANNGYITSPDDADADATNEIQTADEVNITGGTYSGDTVEEALNKISLTSTGIIKAVIGEFDLGVVNSPAFVSNNSSVSNVLHTILPDGSSKITVEHSAMTGEYLALVDFESTANAPQNDKDIANYIIYKQSNTVTAVYITEEVSGDVQSLKMNIKIEEF